MLSIGKLGRGQEGYYLQAVARGVEDYYLGSGEAPGRWIGSGCGGLGLSGRVGADALRAVLDGRPPSDAQRSLIWHRRADRLPGYDLTFSAPKGVSLLFALGPPELMLEVRRAHDTAVAAALGYLEQEAGEVRRGKDGVTRLPGGGFVAAAFRHRTSRAGDPQLHTHVLVANMTCGADSRYSALDGQQLYAQAKTAGTLYQAALRYELRALGLAWAVRDNGLAELADVPHRVLRAFSRRRVEIEHAMAEHGSSGRAGAQAATLATRKAKDYGVRPESLAAEWHNRADALGFDAPARNRLLHRLPARLPATPELVRASAEMLSSDGLTAKASTFGLVGDHHQLPELTAGGAFRALAETLHATELQQNRRQVEVWNAAPSTSSAAVTRAGHWTTSTRPAGCNGPTPAPTPAPRSQPPGGPPPPPTARAPVGAGRDARGAPYRRRRAQPAGPGAHERVRSADRARPHGARQPVRRQVLRRRRPGHRQAQRLLPRPDQRAAGRRHGRRSRCRNPHRAARRRHHSDRPVRSPRQRRARPRLNPSARIAVAAGGELVREDAARPTSPRALHEPALPAAHLDQVRTLELLPTAPLEWHAFSAWLTLLLHRYGPQVLRVKGVLDVQGVGPVGVNGVQHVVHEPEHLAGRVPAGTRLVLILRGLDPDVVERSFLVLNRLGRSERTRP